MPKPLSTPVTSLSMNFTNQYVWKWSYQYGLDILMDGSEYIYLIYICIYTQTCVCIYVHAYILPIYLSPSDVLTYSILYDFKEPDIKWYKRKLIVTIKISLIFLFVRRISVSFCPHFLTSIMPFLCLYLSGRKRSYFLVLRKQNNFTVLCHSDDIK